MLNAEPDMEVVGEAANGIDAVKITQLLKPNVLLLDISLLARAFALIVA